jgi:hypothetical protein
MDDLIASGEVTFVTLVWSTETGRSGQGWVYAYETDLAKYFSGDFTLPSLPPVNQAMAPEAPVRLSELPAPAKSANAPMPDTSGVSVGRPKITRRAFAVFPVLFVIGLLLGTAAAGYIFYIDPSFDNSVSVSARALPSVNGGDSIVLEVSDMAVLRSLLSGVELAISSLDPEMTNEDPMSESVLSRVKSSIEGLKSLSEAMDEMSLLVVPSDGPAVYASFAEKGDAFDAFMSRPGNFFSARTWAPNLDDEMTGWEISLPFSKNPALYVVEHPRGKEDIVYAARTEEGVAAMLSASYDETRRFLPERTTSGRNFLQIKLPNGLARDAIEKGFGKLSRKQNIQTEPADKVLWTMIETSWTKESNVLEYETYSDLPAKNPELAANMPKITQDTKFLGDGELTCFISIDAGFMMECAFPGSADPVGEAFKAFTERQAALPEPVVIGDRLKAIIKNSRLSVVCTAKDGHAQTSYLLLETDAEEFPDEFWRTYAPFVAIFGGEPLKLDGWRSAISLRIPFYGGSSANIVLARKRGALLIGIGESANFSKSVPIKREYKDYISPENVVNIIVSPKFYDTLLGFMDRYYAGSTSGGNIRQRVKNGLTAFRNSFQLLCGNVKPSGHANGRLVLTEGSNPTGAALKLLSQIALALPEL